MADKGTVGDRPSPNFHVICHSIRIGGHFSVWFIYIYIYIYIFSQRIIYDFYALACCRPKDEVRSVQRSGKLSESEV